MDTPASSAHARPPEVTHHAAVRVSGLAAAGRHTLMEWTHDIDQQYTLTQGTCQGMVWRHRHGDWAALVSRDGKALSHDSFTKLEDAQAWCETQITALVAAGRCTGD